MPRGEIAKGVLGMILKETQQDYAEIFLADALSPFSKRLMLAHQIGHFVERNSIHATADEEYAFMCKASEDICSSTPYEHFARIFAMNLLLSEENVRSFIEQHQGIVSAPLMAAHFEIPSVVLRERLRVFGLEAA